MTLKFDRWPWKIIGHLFNTTSSFVCHFKAIRWYKLELQSGNTQFGSKSATFDLEIWWMTLKNNRATLLCHIKLCASFQSYQWIQTWVTVRKHSIQVKIRNFLSRVTLKFDGWPWKTIGHLFYTPCISCHACGNHLTDALTMEVVQLLDNWRGALEHASHFFRIPDTTSPYHGRRIMIAWQKDSWRGPWGTLQLSSGHLIQTNRYYDCPAEGHLDGALGHTSTVLRTPQWHALTHQHCADWGDPWDTLQMLQVSGKHIWRQKTTPNIELSCMDVMTEQWTPNDTCMPYMRCASYITCVM